MENENTNKNLKVERNENSTNKKMEETVEKQSDNAKAKETSKAEEKDIKQETKPVKNNRKKTNKRSKATKKEQELENKLEEALETCEEEKEKHKELNDRYVRLFSEFDNFRKRTNKEKLELRKTASEDVIASLLTIIDDFDRAAEADKNHDDKNAALEGYRLIKNKMMTILKQKGLAEMEAKGTDFDAELHEAISEFPAENDEQKGKVIEVVEKGYYLNEKIIRFAKVVVAK